MEQPVTQEEAVPQRARDILVAERIGRAVSSVYNKVMNFRALDPRDERTGMRAGSKTDQGDIVASHPYDAANEEAIRTSAGFSP